VISAAEERFERGRRRVGLVLAVPLALVTWILSSGDGRAERLAAIMVFTAVLWISEGLPVAVTGLLAAAGCVLLGVATPKEAFASFSHPLLFLFIGSFFIAEAMRVHGLGDRLAAAAFRLAKTRLGVLCAMSGTSFLVSMWISNTAATAVALPIAIAVARSVGDRRFGAALVLSIAYGASMGGLGTPVGTPPNLIGISQLHELTGVKLGFVTWMGVGLPIAVTMLFLLWVVLSVRFGVRGQRLAEVATAARRPWSGGELAVGSVFVAAVLLWMVPGILAVAAPGRLSAWLGAHLTEEIVAILCAGLLFAWPVRDEAGAWRRALTWDEAARIDWATVLLFGAGILLGDLAGKTGLADSLGRALVDATGASSVWGITALVTAAAILLSEATSNTAAATLMLPLTISLATAAGVSPIPPALGATIGSSFGFMLPISTAPNAMAYGTRQVTISQMMSAGIVFDVVGYLVVLAGLRILCPLLGLA
jgi:solute carrier family 13 (sodium-dependent dicarboxylate transporter), member 2/3/5